MMNTDVIVIPLSKSKLLLLFMGSLGFVAVGAWFVGSPSTFADSSFTDVLLIILGCISILFFGACGVAMLFKLLGNKPGFIIDKSGITDNSTAVSVGFIPWSDITGISKTALAGQEFIMIKLRNPLEYIERQHNSATRMALKANNSNYGTPINVSVNGLKCSFGELLLALNQRFERYEANKPSVVSIIK
jgi:hypothetical protein